ncbi:uncharacterized protein CLUP02_12104 [Colletotrichum lupini]|uniref:Uncharacterized protein n=1 Tax=Colletotrichum lupini TaxID=145971 RepID=A0A9Q8WKY0_9PEZI|nr:uncharacterized protein CLUP02_12104 [Colletotrichum lupini]UQC86602.1 hypothetical protein CLUP02_12104 [Colletotrichum lupini]
MILPRKLHQIQKLRNEMGYLSFRGRKSTSTSIVFSVQLIKTQDASETALCNFEIAMQELPGYYSMDLLQFRFALPREGSRSEACTTSSNKHPLTRSIGNLINHDTANLASVEGSCTLK